MAKEIKQWITVNGKHIPIMEGESKQDAINRSIAKDNEDKKQKDISQAKAEADKASGKTGNKLSSVKKKEIIDNLISKYKLKPGAKVIPTTKIKAELKQVLNDSGMDWTDDDYHYMLGKIVLSV